MNTQADAELKSANISHKYRIIICVSSDNLNIFKMKRPI